MRKLRMYGSQRNRGQQCSLFTYMKSIFTLLASLLLLLTLFPSISFAGTCSHLHLCGSLRIVADGIYCSGRTRQACAEEVDIIIEHYYAIVDEVKRM